MSLKEDSTVLQQWATVVNVELIAVHCGNEIMMFSLFVWSLESNYTACHNMLSLFNFYLYLLLNVWQMCLISSFRVPLFCWVIRLRCIVFFLIIGLHEPHWRNLCVIRGISQDSPFSFFMFRRNFLSLLSAVRTHCLSCLCVEFLLIHVLDIETHWLEGELHPSRAFHNLQHAKHIQSV